MRIEEVLALSNIKGLGNASLLKVLHAAEKANTFSVERQHCQDVVKRVLPSRLINSMNVFFDNIEECINNSQKQIASFHSAGISVVSYLDADYPEALSRLDKPPALLFCKGDRALLGANYQRVAIIGTREPSERGKSVTATIAKTLSSQNKVVVSGLAIGIDTIAHEETIRNGKKAIAVVVDVLKIYPAANKVLAEDIVNKGGVIISEYPPGTRVSKGFLVQRDRIQAALSDNVYAIECREGGGTLHAIDAARLLNIPVSVPNFKEWGYQGVNASEIQGLIPLLRDGAVHSFSPQDALE